MLAEEIEGELGAIWRVAEVSDLEVNVCFLEIAGCTGAYTCFQPRYHRKKAAPITVGPHSDLFFVPSMGLLEIVILGVPNSLPAGRLP